MVMSSDRDQVTSIGPTRRGAIARIGRIGGRHPSCRSALGVDTRCALDNGSQVPRCRAPNSQRRVQFVLANVVLRQVTPKLALDTHAQRQRGGRLWRKRHREVPLELSQGSLDRERGAIGEIGNPFRGRPFSRLGFRPLGGTRWRRRRTRALERKEAAW